jgi:hypothetical protein
VASSGDLSSSADSSRLSAPHPAVASGVSAPARPHTRSESGITRSQSGISQPNVLTDGRVRYDRVRFANS